MADDLFKILHDFTNDLLVTFPELEPKFTDELKVIRASADASSCAEAVSKVKEHCQSVYPARFFEVLYQNDTLFASPIELLPGIDFAPLWKENLTDKTRETLWKYLQLILFTVVSNLQDGASFGDTAKLFEAINETEFKSKLEETVKQMHDMFGNADNDGTAADASGNPTINMEDLPNPQDLHDHISGMMDGKLGRLAKEIAEETAAELNMNLEDSESVNDVFKRLFQNPTKLMSLVKTVGSKLDAKLKSGDMKESELLQEASEMLKKMKDMPGMGNLQSMFEKMGMPNMGGKMPGGGGKVNVNAMQANLNRNIRQAKQKEGMLQRLEERRAAAAAAQETVFKKGDGLQRSSPADKPAETTETASSAPSKKGKKKKSAPKA